MWPSQYQDRLASWVDLRHRCRDQTLDLAVLEINTWWFDAPWRPYYLHWDDRASWPDPWQLLADNHYCDLARALGILYTIDLMDRTDIDDRYIAETDLGNLVLINGGKYILNWSPDEILNIQSQSIVIKRSTQHHTIRAYT